MGVARARDALPRCKSEAAAAARPVGVDPRLVGTWELPLPGYRWVLQIPSQWQLRVSRGRARAHSSTGRFAAGEGRWWLKTSADYTDGGDYLFQAPDVLMATGQHGAAAWLRRRAAGSLPTPTG